MEKIEKKVMLINKSLRAINTKYGRFEVGKSMEFPESYAKIILDYSGIIDASTMFHNIKSNDESYILDLKKEIELLRKENEELKKSVQKRQYKKQLKTAKEAHGDSSNNSN